MSHLSWKRYCTIGLTSALLLANPIANPLLSLRAAAFSTPTEGATEGVAAASIQDLQDADLTIAQGGVAAPSGAPQAQTLDGWRTTSQVVQLVNSSQQVTHLAILADVLERPDVSYANAVYQLYAYDRGEWKEVYTSQGSRLIPLEAGAIALSPELVPIETIREALGTNDLSNVQFRSVVNCRHDIRGGARDRQTRFERTFVYRDLEIAQFSDLSQLRTIESSQFRLAIRQSQPNLDGVIARISLRQRYSESFVQERLIGDFRYRINEEAQFVEGLTAGDRVVVRLFDLQNRFIGYSEFEVLAGQSIVNLVLSDQTGRDGLVRTVYGYDRNNDNRIDTNTSYYDYFTQVRNVRNVRNSSVTYFRTTNNINVSRFQSGSLPNLSQGRCTYPSSFQSGSFATANRRVRAFSSSLSQDFFATPSTSQTIFVASSSSYQVRQMISSYSYEYVTISNGGINTICDLGCSGNDDDDYEYNDDDDNDDDDDDDYGYDDNDDDNDDDDDHRGRDRDRDRDRDRGRGRDRDRRQNCNQGIGNGAEGCDPGNSRPRGGSNDEGGRRPGGRNNSGGGNRNPGGVSR